jgi:hypothetical protein
MRSTGISYGLSLGTVEGTPSDKAIIANNMFAITEGLGANIGMQLGSLKNIDIYYNSINIVSGNTNSKAINILSYGVLENINVKNNILRDTSGYTIYNSNASTTQVFDYNEYYSNTTNMAYWGGNNITNLTDLQAANSMDAHSKDLNFDFQND